nr:20_t:CDS:2 [Entrophospora candida]
MHKLQISVGTSYDPSTHKIILPNEENPYFIDTEHIVGRIGVRIRDFQGITPSGKDIISSSKYFENNNYQYSIQVQAKFKGNNKWTADDIVFGNDFDHKINLPPGSWLGLKILQWIDPGLEADIYSDKPSAFSPLLFTMNVINLHYDENSADLPDWPSFNGNHIMEGEIYSKNSDKIISACNTSDRKKYFSVKENRQDFKITQDQIWNFDFFNSYIDFNKIAVKLPGFEISVLQYWDGQPLRYVCKSRDSSVVFFVVIFQLIEVDQENISEVEEILSDEERIQQLKIDTSPLINKLIEEQRNKEKELFKKIQDENDLTPKSNAIWSSVKSPSILKIPKLRLSYEDKDDHDLSNLNLSSSSSINE